MHGIRDLIQDDGDTRRRTSLEATVMEEIRHELAPYQAEQKLVTAETVIYRDLSIDSLAVMDIVLELEERFDVAIPINAVAEIRTVQELADAIMTLKARR